MFFQRVRESLRGLRRRWLSPIEVGFSGMTRIEHTPTLTIGGKVVDLGTPAGQRLQKTLDDLGDAIESYLSLEQPGEAGPGQTVK